MDTPHDLEMRPDSEGIMWLSGELDMANADSFLERTMGHLDGQPAAVLDLSALEFLDSSGIRAILRIAKVRTDGVVLRNPQPNVRKVLEVAGIDAFGVRVDPTPQ
jgi:anti-anti-sigma factor